MQKWQISYYGEDHTDLQNAALANNSMLKNRKRQKTYNSSSSDEDIFSAEVAFRSEEDADGFEIMAENKVFDWKKLG